MSSADNHGAPVAEAGLGYATGPGRWVLVVTVLGSAMTSIDATVVDIALPAIGRDFGAGLTALQWVVMSYTLTLAGLLLFAGALGNRYGRKRIFLAGVVWFAMASLVCGFAPNAALLIGARAVQGVGGALLTPGSLAIIEASFRPADRGKAIGACSGLSAAATAIGPFLGGWLVQAVSWRLIFAINLPVAAVIIAAGVRHVPESRDTGLSGRPDIAGGILATAGLTGVTYGPIAGPCGGWTRPPALMPVIAGAPLLACLVAWERRARAPMLPLSLFASGQFSAANVVTFAVYGALAGALLLLPVELQQVSGYTALQAGISLLPVTAIMLVLSARSGALAARIGPRLQVSTGPAVIAAGLALFTRIGRELPHRGAPGGRDLRPRPGHHRGAADSRGAGRRSRPPCRHGIGGQQRRRPHGRAHRGRRPSRCLRAYRHRLPSPRRGSRPDSARHHSSRPACAWPAARWPYSPSATLARRPARHRSGGTARRPVTLEPLAGSRTEPPSATRHRRDDR